MHSRPDFIFRCQTIPIVFAMGNSIPCANWTPLKRALAAEYLVTFELVILYFNIGFTIVSITILPFSHTITISLSLLYLFHTLRFYIWFLRETSFSAATNGYKRCAWWTLTVNWLEKTRWIRTWVHYIEINSSISFLHSASSLNSLIIINYEHLRNIIFRLSFLFSPSISNYPSYWQPKGLSGRLHGKISSWEVHFSLYYLLVQSFQLIIVPTPVKVYTN